MFRRLITISVPLAVFLLLGWASVAPASAAAYAYDSAAVRPAASHSCPYQYLCIWNNTTGQEIEYYYCETDELPDWTGPGYVYNNQSDHQAMAFLDANYDPTIGYSAGAQGSINWDPIWYVMVCDGPPGG